MLRVISQRGPITVAGLVDDLALTETSVRRHLENLAAQGLVEDREVPGPRRRGRPARAWIVSDRGHAALAAHYDNLAEQAVRFLAETAGDDAVTAFAERRVAQLEQRWSAALAEVGDDATDRAHALASALSEQGYAATARPVGGDEQSREDTRDQPAGAPVGAVGIQVCQGHCPVQHVAEQFPQFCEAETQAFSRLLGIHVQRLATLAHGDHACTTFVPTVHPSPPHVTARTHPRKVTS